MYCEKCGQQITENTAFCSNCGTSINREYVTYDYDSNKPYADDKPSFLFALIGFFIPIIGLILFLVYEGKRPKRAKSAGKGALTSIILKIVISIVFFVLYALGIAFAVGNTPEIEEHISSVYSDLVEDDSVETVLENYVDVTIGDFKIKKDEYGLTETSLSVTVKNKSEEKSTIVLTIEAVDKDGARIDTDTVYANTLNPNQKMNLKAFEYVPDDELNQMKNARFKVLKINRYDF